MISRSVAHLEEKIIHRKRNFHVIPSVRAGSRLAWNPQANQWIKKPRSGGAAVPDKGLQDFQQREVARSRRNAPTEQIAQPITTKRQADLQVIDAQNKEQLRQRYIRGQDSSSLKVRHTIYFALRYLNNTCLLLKRSKWAPSWPVFIYQAVQLLPRMIIAVWVLLSFVPSTHKRAKCVRNTF